MNKNKQSLQKLLYILFGILALVMVIDFIIPGTVVNNEIITLKRDRQQYYNAAQNHHYTYKVITNSHEFYITEDAATLNQNNKKIQYAVSKIFKEVNWYQLQASQKTSYYSLRIISGLVLPVLFIITIAIVYRSKRNLDILVFVLHILLLANLIFLIL